MTYASMLKGRPPAKREISAPWHTTLSGWRWWGDSFMAIRGVPFWPDLETEDLVERMSRPPYSMFRKGRGSPLRAALVKVIRLHNAGETLPIRLKETAKLNAPVCAYPVRVAYSARNGQRLRGWGGSAPCVINAGLATFIERRIKGGSWFVTSDRTAFVYDVDGRMRALVMGIRTNGCNLEEASDD